MIEVTVQLKFTLDDDQHLKPEELGDFYGQQIETLVRQEGLANQLYSVESIVRKTCRSR